jgi:5-methylcytosine-specific restriction endonuclease McrA
MNDIIRTSNLNNVAPAMLAHPGAWSNLLWRSGMFILTPKKQCTTCGEWKHRGEFYKDKNKSDGLYSRCKECHKKATIAWAKKNPNAVSKIRRSYWVRHLEENRERDRKNVNRYRAENIEKVREYDRARYLKRDPEKRREISRKSWAKNYLANLEKYIIKSRNRRALKRGNGGKITKAEWNAICEKYGNKCLYPGCDRTDITMDHVIPLKLGGTHTVDNVQPLCKSHNYSKGKKIADYR